MSKVTRSHSSQPTPSQYQAFTQLFDHFNSALFPEPLPQPMLVFSRRKMVHGHFRLAAWQDAEGHQIDEISLNPDRFSDTAPDDFASTLLHEMCHQFQYHFGRPGRAGYHNAEFAQIMETRGLLTTSTGQPGGARTGQRMDHLIAPQGPFLRSFGELGSELFFPFRCLTTDELPKKLRPNANKTKYASTTRGVWGAPGLLLVDGLTGDLLEEVPAVESAPRETPRLALLRAVGQLSDTECEDALQLLQTAQLI